MRRILGLVLLTGFNGAIAEEAQKSVKGMEDNAIHAKYIELVRRLNLYRVFFPPNHQRLSLQN